jgi:transcriptional regulator with XRE-family HTH domain
MRYGRQLGSIEECPQGFGLSRFSTCDRVYRVAISDVFEVHNRAWSGAVVRRARLMAELTQQQLADVAGTIQQHVAAIENGRRQPTHPALARLLRATGFELRTRLEPFDPHDETIEEWFQTQPIDFQQRWADHQRTIVSTK